MAPQLSRYTMLKSARRRRSPNAVRLSCERLEDRVTPSLFNVQNPPLAPSGLNNNGCVVVSDFNKDGLSDAVMTNFGTDYGAGAGTTITLMYGKQAGGFNYASLATGGKNVAFAAVGDINGDTWPDLVVANANQQNTGSVSVFKNDGAGNLSLFGNPFSTASNNPGWIGLSDITGDNVLDVVVGSFGKVNGQDINGNNVTIFQGNGDATFSGSPTTTLAPQIQFIPTALAVADFDGDGIKDIAAAVPGVPLDSGQPQPDGNIYLFRGTGSGGFAAFNTVSSGGALPVNIQAADLNGDTKLDLVVANAGDPNAGTEWGGKAIGVLLNTSSSGSVSFGVPNSLTANTYGPFAVAVADFDLNGKPDIAAINFGAQFIGQTAFVSIYMGAGNGTFSPPSAPEPQTYDTQTGTGGGQYLAVGNFDTNSAPDLIIAHASNKVGFLYNTTTAVPTVTINQGATQADPTNGASIKFDVVFSEGVNGFTDADVDLSASSVSGLSASVNAVSSSVYEVSVTGMTGTGNVKASIPAGAATSVASGLASLASTSGDNQVNFDYVAPTVTINQASAQADPATSAPIGFTVVFSESVSGFTSADIDLSESTLTGLSASVTPGGGTGTTFTVVVNGMSASGTVVAKVKVNAATDAAGNQSAASTSTDNTVTFSVNNNQAPAISLSTASATYNEGDPATVLDGGATVTDADSPDFDTGTLTVDYTANGNADDRLEIRNQGDGAGQIGVSGTNVSFGGIKIGTFSGGVGTTPLVVTLNASATPAAVEALVRNITFRNVSDAPSTNARSVRFRVSDGDGGTSNAASLTVNVNPANDPPVIGGTLANQTANDNANVLLFSSVTITDPDLPAQTLTVTVQISNAANGVFTANSLTLSGFNNAGGGLFTFTGTAANAQTAIRQLVFDPTDNQVAPGNVVSTSFTISVNDGFAAPVSNNNTSVNATSVNDAPVIGGAVADQPVSDKAIAAVFSSLTVTDPDNESVSVTVTILNGVNRGDFTGISTAGWTRVTSGADIIYTRNVSGANVGGLVQAAVRALVFKPRENVLTPGATEKTIFTVSVDDSGAPVANSGEISVVTTSLNDLPTGLPRRFKGHAPLRVRVVKGLLLGAVDPDVGAQLTTRLFSKPKRGKVRIKPTGAFVYVPPAGFVGRVKFFYVIDDGQGGTSAPIQVILRII
jgi:hypothetical protein